MGWGRPDFGQSASTKCNRPCSLNRGSDFSPQDEFWSLQPQPGDVIVRTKQYMASPKWETCHVHLPRAVAQVRVPLGLPNAIAPRNPIPADYKDHILKFIPSLEQYKLYRAAEHLKSWVLDQLVLQPLLDVSAWLDLVNKLAA